MVLIAYRLPSKSRGQMAGQPRATPMKGKKLLVLPLATDGV